MWRIRWTQFAAGLGISSARYKYVCDTESIKLFRKRK